MDKEIVASNIKFLRNFFHYTQKEVAQRVGVSDKAVSAWERGAREPKMGPVQKMADMFGVSTEEFVNTDLSKNRNRPSNLLPITHRKIPVLGPVAGGVPLYVDEEIDVYEDDDTGRCDFALRVVGDSMEPEIQDGDIVFVRKQSSVINGGVAVVLDGDSATLKRLYVTSRGITLISNNPAYAPMEYTGDAANDLRVIGQALAFKRGLIKKGNDR